MGQLDDQQSARIDQGLEQQSNLNGQNERSIGSQSSLPRVKARSKWRPELPEINWQDCFCICFFIYLLCSETESEKRRKEAKKREKEILKRSKEMAKKLNEEKKKRIKEMIKETEKETDEDKKKDKSVNKVTKDSQVINKDLLMKKRQLKNVIPQSVEQPEKSTKSINNLDSDLVNGSTKRPYGCIIAWNDLN